MQLPFQNLFGRQFGEILPHMDTLLPGHETEPASHLQQEGFDIAKDGGFQVAFAVAVGELKKVEDAQSLSELLRFSGCFRDGTACSKSIASTVPTSSRKSSGVHTESQGYSTVTR